MLSRLFVHLQYLLPKHLISVLAGKLAEATTPWLKNFLIKKFIAAYSVDMKEAAVEDPEQYESFNAFFTRELIPNVRTIAPGRSDLACPVDGTVAQIGHINNNQLIQAKNSYFNLETLLGNDIELAKYFYNGSFATLYLAPHNYHRIHMPLTGRLTQTIYVPGKLFSVNRMTAAMIPNLYGRNERFVTVFDTDAGKMAVILVGALIVGSMQTVWMNEPVRGNDILNEVRSDDFSLNKGEELGLFKLGSTVILLFENDKMQWDAGMISGKAIKVGEKIGGIKHEIRTQ